MRLSEYHASALTGVLNREIWRVQRHQESWVKNGEPDNAEATREYLEQLNTLVRTVDAARMKEGAPGADRVERSHFRSSP